MSQVRNLESWYSKWTWISSLTFGCIATAVKLVFFPSPYFSVPAVFIFLAPFLLIMLCWHFVATLGMVSLYRAGVVGAVVGILTPALLWILYGPYLAFTSTRPWEETLAWSMFYVLIFPLQAGWLTVPLGVMLGVVVAFLQQRDYAHFDTHSENYRGEGVV